MSADGTPLGYNLFAYCGNSPVSREDTRGNFWLVSVGVGLATQYFGDVLGNLAEGKKGADIFRPTSTVGEYIAAGVTALIPGTGFVGAVARNAVAEGISIIEDTIKGNEVSFSGSMMSIGLGVVCDMGFEKISGKAVDFISSKMPKNYSSYAYTVRQSKPNMTREQIQLRMQRSIKANQMAAKAVSLGLDIIRAALPC